MSQKSDDSIEKFFRKAAVQQDRTFMERDWQSMQKMLDEQDMIAGSQQSMKTKTVLKVSALLLIASLLFFIGIEKNKTSDSVQMQAAVAALGPQTEAKSESPTADLHPLNSDEPKVTLIQKHASATVDLNKPALSEKQKSLVASQKTLFSGTSKSPVTAQIISNSFGIPGEAPSRKPSSVNTKSSDLNSSDQPRVPHTAHSTETVIANDETVIVNEAASLGSGNHVVTRTDYVSDSKKIEKPYLMEAAPDSIEESIVKQIPADETIEKREKEAQSGIPRFSVTALFSPDFSTTSLTRYSKPSGVFGLMVGFKLVPRFTLVTGATKALKKYEGYGNDYSPPPGYWQNKTNGVVPDEVEGNCGIIEVPLIIQYDLVQHARSRFFVSAGVSSYFMRSEHYQYVFREPNPGAANSWTAKEPTQYLFKIGHLSAGYDRMISSHFAVGIEPFLKVPFEGIGWTDINLYSTGAYLNLRYVFSANPKL